MNPSTRRFAWALSVLFLSLGPAPVLAEDPCDEPGTDPDTMYDLCRAAGNSHADCHLNTLVYICNCDEGTFDFDEWACEFTED